MTTLTIGGKHCEENLFRLNRKMPGVVDMIRARFAPADAECAIDTNMAAKKTRRHRRMAKKTRRFARRH